MKKQAFNPFLPGYEYVPDGEPHVFGERLYLYGSHDAFDGETYCVNDYVCWSAPVEDLSDWKYEGTIYRKDQDPHNKGNRSMFAPDVAKGPDGRYYLYYTLDLKREAGIVSVAVSDTPAGPYEYYGDVHDKSGHVWGSGENEILNYDPGIFIDDDGRIYLYTGIALPQISGLKKKVNMLKRRADGAYVVELEFDMLTMKKEPVKIFGEIEEAKGTEFEGHAFFEASSMRKIDGRYYFIYCSEKSHELCYAVSNRPEGDFRFGGTIISIGDIGYRGCKEEDARNYYGNTHGSIEKIGNQWYVFYHRHTNLDQFSRQACSERIEINPDGSISQVELTSCGLNGGPLDGHGYYEARIACNLRSSNGVFAYEMIKHKENRHPYFTQEMTDGNDADSSYIANIQSGSLIGFKYFAFAGPKTLTVITRGNARGLLKVFEETEADYSAELKIMPHEEWQEAKVDLKKIEGVKPLFFTYEGTGSLDFKGFNIE